MDDSQLFIITFESFQKLTILKKEEILQLAIEHIMKKQQELYPILTCIRNYVRVKQLFNTLKHLNDTLCQIVTKFSQVPISHCQVATETLPSIYAVKKLAIDIFDLQEMLLDTIVLHNKIHDHRSLDLMYKALEKFGKIQQQLFQNYATA